MEIKGALICTKVEPGKIHFDFDEEGDKKVFSKASVIIVNDFNDNYLVPGDLCGNFSFSIKKVAEEVIEEKLGEEPKSEE